MSTIPRPDVPSGSILLARLTGLPTAQSSFSETPLIRTRQGVRYRSIGVGRPTSSLAENHRDIYLATFAECGMPLSTPVRMDGSTTSSLSAVLQDSVANCDLKQAEIEWSSIAYTIYMSDRTGWRDRDGNWLTFDQLATALLGRDPSRSSCGGAHVLLAMTYLLRADEDAHFLSQVVRDALRARLQAAVQTVVQTQGAEGSWTNPWARHNAQTRGSHSFSRILTTGHLLEWLQYVPVDLQPAQSTYERGANWLILHLQQLQHSPSYNSPGWICPWAHAVCALRNLCSQE